jgi:hypothetical protein
MGMISYTLRLLYHRGNSMRHSLNRSLGGPSQSTYIRFGKEENFLPLSGIETLVLVATRCHLYAHVSTQQNNKLELRFADLLSSASSSALSSFQLRILLCLSTYLGSFLFQLLFLPLLKLLFFPTLSATVSSTVSCFFPSLFLASSKSSLFQVLTKNF